MNTSKDPMDQYSAKQILLTKLNLVTFALCSACCWCSSSYSGLMSFIRSSWRVLEPPPEEEKLAEFLCGCLATRFLAAADTEPTPSSRAVVRGLWLREEPALEWVRGDPPCPPAREGPLTGLPVWVGAPMGGFRLPGFLGAPEEEDEAPTGCRRVRWGDRLLEPERIFDY